MIARRIAFLSAVLTATIGLTSPSTATPSPSSEEKPPPAAQDASRLQVEPGKRSANASAAGTYRVDNGYDLDQYLCRESTPLDFSINVPDSFGPVTTDGAPAPGNALYGKNLSLTMRVYDVDEQYGEVDILSVNGHQQPGKLTGADDQWSINTFSVPAAHLRLPTNANPSGRNDFSIDIDSTDDGWCVQIDYAQLTMQSNRVPPVMFVHGITGNNGPNGESTMSDFKNAFALQQREVLGRVAAPRLTQHGSIQYNSALLFPKIRDLTASEPVKQVDLVTHSMGGLDARQYAWDHPDQVRRIVMIGTPNGGSPLADVLCANRKMPGGLLLTHPTLWLAGVSNVALNQMFASMGPCDSASDGLYQLQTGYMQGFNNQVKDWARVRYATIAGRGNGPASALLPGEDDGVVPVSSVRALSRHQALNPLLDRSHSGLVGVSSLQPALTMSRCWLYDNSPSDCGGSGWVAVKASASDDRSRQAAAGQDEYQLAGSINDQLTAGQTKTYAMPVPEGTQAQLIILPSNPALQTSVTKGTFETGTELEVEGRKVAFTGPDTLTVTNPSSDTVGFISMLMVQSQRSLQTTVPTVAAPGSSVTARAVLTGSTVGDQLKWQVTDEQGTVVAVGDYAPTGTADTWSATFPAPQEGSYSVTSWVGGSESRLDTQPLQVADDASFAGTIRDAGVDTNDNYLYDRLDVSADLTVKDAGDYVVAATLVNGQGDTVAVGQGRQALSAGQASITLNFDGEEIYQAGLPGPWTVRDLTISRDDGRIVQIVANAGQTSLIPLSSFEHSAVSVAKRVTDTPTDLDGNGKYDRLDIGLGITAVEAGDYAMNARLLDPQGNEITRSQSEFYLPTGASDVTLTFDGAAIGGSGADGPYRVADLSVYPLTGTGSGVSVIDVHTTQSYRARSFENFSYRAPEPPTNVTATAGDGTAAVSWSAPASSGSGSIAGYTVTSDPGAKSCSTSGRECTVEGLVNGRTYTFVVTATNSDGLTSNPSQPSNPVTPTARALPPTFVPGPTPAVEPTTAAAPTPLLTVPGRVAKLKARSVKGRLFVKWQTVPGATGYLARISPVSKKPKAWKQVTGTSTSFKGKQGVRYVVQVRAVNGSGRGAVATVRARLPK